MSSALSSCTATSELRGLTFVPGMVRRNNIEEIESEMGIFSKEESFTEAEQKIIGILLSGESAAFARLRRQCQAPFLLEVQRSIAPTRYTLSLVYDGNLETEYSIGNSISVQIDDLAVIDKRLGNPVTCKAVVHHGVLGNVLFSASSAMQWPTYVKLDDWFFLASDGSTTKERSIDWSDRLRQSAEPQRFHPQFDAMLPADYQRYILRSLELAVGSANLLHPNEVYLLDDPRVQMQMLVFAIALDGSVLAFKVEGTNGETNEVYLLDHQTGEASRVANSFDDWLSGGDALEG